MNTAQEPGRRPGFWETRTGWRRLKQLLFLEPLPGGARWSAAFGSLLLFTFVLQVVTGILLAMYYVPSTEPVQTSKPYVSAEGEVQEKVPTAWASVRYIQEEVPLGALIRGLHHWGSSAMVILLLLHLVQVFVWGAYKKPRELTWMVGVLLLVCILGLAFTGYLLPWDQKAFWATKVGVSIASTTPLIGDSLRTLLQGGSQMGNLTLTRFFTFHGFVLPALVVVLIAVHLYLFRVHGVTPSWWQSDAQLQATEEPFWPKQVLKDAVLILALLVGLGLWVYWQPAPLEEPANPSKSYQARPEWYFMFLFQLLRYFHGPYEIVGTFVLPTLFFLVLFFWPFLDRNPHRDPRRRPLAMGLLGLGTAGLVGLTIFALATDVRMKEPAQAAAKAPTPTERAGPIQRADVARLFTTHCASCHGVDGSGSEFRKVMPTLPDFTSLAWQLSQTELEITHRILDGNEPLMPAYRDKLAQNQILALTVYVRAFAVLPQESSTPKKVQPVTPAAQMSSAQVYRTYCLACHEADGRGRTVRQSRAMPEMPDFTDLAWKSKPRQIDVGPLRITIDPDKELKHSILYGKGKFMLPMKDKLSEADAEQMVEFVRAFRAKQIVPEEPIRPIVKTPSIKPEVVPARKDPTVEPAETAERVRAAAGLYRQYCLICHGPDGQGREFRASMPTVPDFTRSGWQKSVSEVQLRVTIREGKGLMPAFDKTRVKDEQLRNLIAYIRAFGPEKTRSSTEVPAGDFEKKYRELQDQWDELQKQLEELKRSKP